MAPGGRVESPPRRHWKESVLVSAEDPSVSQTARPSPFHQRNGHEDRKGSVSRMEETRGSTPPTHPEHLSTGPASRAAKGSSSLIPYIDCSVVDSEYIAGREQTARSNHSHRDQAMSRRGSGGSGSVNMASLAQQEHFVGRTCHIDPPSSPKPSLNTSHDFNEHFRQMHARPVHSPIHGTMVDFRERHNSSPLTVQHMMGPKSYVTGPAMDTFRPATSLSYAEQNGYGTLPPHLDEARYPRSPRLQKLHKICHNSDSVPNAGAYPMGQESRPVLSRADRMAALERRMAANGLSAPGRSRTGLGQSKRLGHSGVMGAVQMNDGSTTSGSESSESELDTNKGNCSPQVFNNPAEAGSSSPIPRNKFSFGSLQLDEEADEDGCQANSDEDSPKIFSC